MAGNGGDIDWRRQRAGIQGAGIQGAGIASGPVPGGTGRGELRYGEVLRDAMMLVRDRRRDLGRLLLAPLLIAFVVQTINLFTAPSEGIGAVFGGLGPIAFLITIYLSVWLAVSVTRLVLWGRIDGYLPVWRRADWRYFGYMLLFWAGFLLVAAFLSTFLGVGAAQRASGEMAGMVAGALQALMLAGVICIYPFSRVWLILPAAALGRGYGLARVWADSAGQAGTLIALLVTLIGLVFFTGLLNMAIVLPLSGLLGSPVPGLALAQALNFALGVFAALVAATAFARRVGPVPPPTT